MSQLEQRSMEWRQLRLGDVTASRFRDVLTNPVAKKDKEAGKLSATAEAYMLELIAELMTGQPADRAASTAMKWGIQWEDTAREAARPVIEREWGQTIDLPVRELAYVTHPTEAYVGCSPDGGIGYEALLEIKCPYNSARHVAALMDPQWLTREHAAQIQGSLWVTGRMRYMAVSFDPRFDGRELVACPVERDEKYIAELSGKVLAFRDELLRRYHELMELPF